MVTRLSYKFEDGLESCLIGEPPWGLGVPYLLHYNEEFNTLISDELRCVRVHLKVQGYWVGGGWRKKVGMGDLLQGGFIRPDRNGVIVSCFEVQVVIND